MSSLKIEFSDYIETRTPIEALDGSEKLVASKDGEAGQLTVAQIVALVPSVGTGVTDGDKTGVQVSGSGTIWLPSDYRNATVITTGPTITLAHNSKYESFFTGLTSFATPKTLVRTGEERTLRWTFMWEVTDLAATIDFGEDTRAPSNMTAGLFVDGVFTPLDVGAYKVVATRRYDDIWWLDFKGVYSVGDAPPTPDPTTWVKYNDDSDVFYDSGAHVEYDS